MRFVMFYHSLVSDWNHGNAHFLRGVVTELLASGHEVEVFEPHDAWSRQQLLEHEGSEPLEGFARAYPNLRSNEYDLERLELDRMLEGADVVLVHEWNAPELVARIGAHRRAGGRYALLFHDTHHRSATAPREMEQYQLKDYDAVLAFGEVIRRRYLERGWCHRAFTWHEAADTRVFRPRPDIEPERDVVWIGNWGDDERSAELYQFLLEPIAKAGLSATVHGVRYPDEARAALADRNIAYRGWLPNYAVPETFARHRVTVHVPRRPYVEALPGIPTIRPFEALACGIPLVTAPWRDEEELFTPGEDFLVAHDGEQMQRHLRNLLADPPRARELARHGLRTIERRHTCRHRARELLDIVARVRPKASTATREDGEKVIA